MVSRYSDLKDNMTEDEIKQKLSIFMSDELQAEFLENCLRKKLQESVKKNTHILLSQIYEKKRWYENAIRNLSAAASCTTVYREKTAIYMKIGHLNIKENNHIFARDAFKLAIDNASNEEKKKLSDEIKNIYLNEAKTQEGNGKNSKAVSIYEYALDLLNDAEKRQVKEKMSELYEKLGRIKESMRIKQSI